MRENAETGKPASEQACDPVRKGNVDRRQPSLSKPHHENARRGDGDGLGEGFMETPIGIHNCSFRETRSWQGFPGENRLKSHSETCVRRQR
jgi:hypothetical protein